MNSQWESCSWRLRPGETEQLPPCGSDHPHSAAELQQTAPSVLYPLALPTHDDCSWPLWLCAAAGSASLPVFDLGLDHTHGRCGGTTPMLSRFARQPRVLSYMPGPIASCVCTLCASKQIINDLFSPSGKKTHCIIKSFFAGFKANVLWDRLHNPLSN